MTNSAKIKVYQEVLDQIRLFIEENNLTEGDRLPSERELAEQLNAGRSSVREALRAIELLGLIETKHGEGTFLKTYRPYHTVEVLSTFVLRQTSTKEELLEVLHMLEQQCIQKAHQHLTQKDYVYLYEEIQELDLSQVHAFFYNYLFEKVQNQLLLKIWHLVHKFSQSAYQPNLPKLFYIDLLKLIQEKKLDKASHKIERVYQELSLD
ncbi:FadR/GntR family transcriptional regulator [Tenuibacillus multivorans]|uniref:DNA-binding transcriptional regulator, FadR family n=1 Tax=Tenuibacillus multivorans TaxID=237069 RepID=A0A1G9ZUZ7_9BACI|nr:GntR family transcriptional regulator [Tenuibacillus multivorans]GEL76856.1 GntR family transcriptional regulator [Tenuibacillus multivorans]SDN24887.1 DNA-binding transcriptional regulator, FadR family [Tenuibacillus multivorans]